MGKNKKNVRTENKLDQHFKEQLQHFNAEPPSFMWDNIEEQLNTEREKSKFDHWYYVILALLIPFTIANLMLNYKIESRLDRFYDNTNKQIAQWINKDKDKHSANTSGNKIGNKQNTLRGKQHHKSTHYNSISENQSLNNSDDKYASAKVGRKKKSKILASNNQSPIVFNSSSQYDLLTREFESSLTLQTKQIQGIQFDDKGEINAEELKFYTENLENTTKKKINNLKGFYLGADVKMNNNWLLMRKNNLNTFFNKNIDYNFEYGYAYALSAGYNFTPYFGIETEVIYARQGQSYVDNTIRKLPVSGSVDLTYLQLPIMMKYRWAKVSGITQNPVAFNVLFGFTYGYLLRYQHIIETELRAVDAPTIPKHELGLTVGFDYDIFLSKNAFLTVGTRASVASDAGAFPFIGSDKFNSINLMAGVNASINFQLRPKVKNITSVK